MSLHHRRPIKSNKQNAYPLVNAQQGQVGKTCMDVIVHDMNFQLVRLQSIFDVLKLIIHLICIKQLFNAVKPCPRCDELRPARHAASFLVTPHQLSLVRFARSPSVALGPRLFMFRKNNSLSVSYFYHTVSLKRVFALDCNESFPTRQ